jgi:hypothetical protein
MRQFFRVLCALGAMGVITLAGISQQPSGGLSLLAGTKLELAVTRAVWTAKVKAGDTLYAETVFPVAIAGRMVIPAGTWVEGQIESVTPPTRRQDRAVFHLRFTKIIYANGYMAELPSTGAAVTVQVGRGSDILLDNGTQMEISVGADLELDGTQVAAAIAVSHAPKPGEFAHATLCRPTPGSPGSTGTTIPGTPGTPPTVIPGGPGMPPTVIPGTPGTPSSVVGAYPGSPGTVCPAPPIVISSVPEGGQELAIKK